mmetsp:Transcript_101331/g.284072  ORF Transcript_101331/g.284072 Transcript_101331/m.284072 type:complete len:205 (+) Transcript_101331:298-912(+)
MDPTTITIKFSGRPLQKKSRIFKLLDKSCDFARTTTLAGVAVGNINPREQPIVAGNTKANGLWIEVRDAEYNAGSSVVAVPMAENSCVAMDVIKMINRFNVKGWTDSVILENPLPMAMLSPDSAKPLEMAKPPPTRRRRPKSNLSCTAGHVRSACRGRTDEGIKKSNTAGRIASVGSAISVSPYGDVTILAIWGRNKSSTNWRV